MILDQIKTQQTFLIISALVFVGLIFSLMIAVIVIRIVKKFKQSKNKKADSKELTTEEKEYREQLFFLLGTKENVLDISGERTKLIVKTKDVAKVDGQKLKAFCECAVLIVGDEVKIVFNEKTPNILKLLKTEETGEQVNTSN